MCSGLPFTDSTYTARSRATTSGGTSSRRTYCGDAPTICSASSRASALKSCVLATKSDSHSSSTSAPCCRRFLRSARRRCLLALTTLRLGALRKLTLAQLLQSFGDAFANGADDQPAAANGVVISGDDVLDQVGITVGVGDGDDGDAE